MPLPQIKIKYVTHLTVRTLAKIGCQAAAQAGLGPVRETDRILLGSDDRLVDLLLSHWNQGREAALDFTVVNPL